MLLGGRPASKSAHRQGQVSHDLVGAFDGEPLLFELRQNGAQKGVVPLAGGRDHGRKGRQSPQIRNQRGEVGPAHVARQADGLAAGPPQSPETFSQFGDPHLRTGEGG